MGTTRFLSASGNLVLRYQPADTYPRIINGDGAHYTNPPALQQDDQFPMANVHSPSRYLPWVTPLGSTPSPLYLQVDVGSDKAAAYVGFHAMRWFGVAGNVSFDVGYRTNAEGYPSGGGTFTSVSTGTIIASERDRGAIFAGGPGRYWQFKFTGSITAGLSFGAIHLGAVTSDLGFLYAPGEIEDLIHPTIQERNGAGHLTATQVGDDRCLVTMPMRSLGDADRAKIDAVFGRGTVRDPAVWLDRADVARQVVLAHDSLAWKHAWSPSNLWDADLNLEVLG